MSAKMNRFAAINIASKITKVPAAEIQRAWTKGAKPQGKLLNAVIVAAQLQAGTFHRKAEATAEA